MRDSLKDGEYFENFHERKVKFLEKYLDASKDETLAYDKRLGFAYDFFRNSCHVAIAAYSAGRPVPEVKALSHCYLLQVALHP